MVIGCAHAERHRGCELAEHDCCRFIDEAPCRDAQDRGISLPLRR